jgi:hypothetical protein
LGTFGNVSLAHHLYAAGSAMRIERYKAQYKIQ